MKRYIAIIFLFLLTLSFFIPALVQQKILLPADTIVGLYYPYRDFYAKDYPRGIPYKNFLITDPVRQQYPWKQLVVTAYRQQSLPLWNPYSFTGVPLLANVQSGALYPFTLFLMVNTVMGWNLYIITQPVLASIFLYLYLRNLRLTVFASLLGAFAFAYSGFMVSWLEWGNIGHTALWLPLVLLSVDKMVRSDKGKVTRKELIKSIFLWSGIFIFSLTSSFFAGHLQTFFYVLCVVIGYFLVRWVQFQMQRKSLLLFACCLSLVTLLALPQLVPALQFISLSARGLDQLDWQKAGWFIPWQQSIQFLAPDFFGNPSTLNYFGVWNYGEFIGYIGIVPLVFALYALLLRRDKETLLFALILGAAVIFAFPTWLAKLPFILSIPLISTAQPTRLLFVIDFGLAVLTALGFDAFYRKRKLSIIPLSLLAACFAALWLIVSFAPSILSIPPESIVVAKRNLQLPTITLILASFIILLTEKFPDRRVQYILMFSLGLLVLVDLLRFTGKYTPFSSSAYVYPDTKIISFLKQHAGSYRVQSLDSRILPPNFLSTYKVQTIEGYDPLYLLSYAELITSVLRGKADYKPPFGFNRIITPQSLSSKFRNLLGVKYVLSLTELSEPNLKKIMQEGETRLYENTAVYPRAFFVSNVQYVLAGDKKSTLSFLLNKTQDLRLYAVVDGNLRQTSFASGEARIIMYEPNRVRVKTQLPATGFLVFTDTYYPTWKAKLQPAKGDAVSLPIFKTDYAYRGVVVPAGTHIVEFTNGLF